MARRPLIDGEVSIFFKIKRVAYFFFCILTRIPLRTDKIRDRLRRRRHFNKGILNNQRIFLSQIKLASQYHPGSVINVEG